MRWTPDTIRAKADAMERRLDRPATVTPETTRLVVEALRFFAARGFAERQDGYTIEVWDTRRGTVAEEVGQIAILAVAEAVFDAVLEARPGCLVTLRKKALKLRERRAPGAAAADGEAPGQGE